MTACPDNHVCFYQLEKFGGNMVSYPEQTPPSECKRIDISVGKSVHNWTGNRIEVFESADCSGRHETLDPDTSNSSLPFAARSFKQLPTAL